MEADSVLEAAAPHKRNSGVRALAALAHEVVQVPEKQSRAAAGKAAEGRRRTRQPEQARPTRADCQGITILVHTVLVLQPAYPLASHPTNAPNPAPTPKPINAP